MPELNRLSLVAGAATKADVPQPLPRLSPPLHGGAIALAADALDLSTGVAPWAWPVPELPEACWTALPKDDGQLENAAAAYFGCKAEQLCALPGSQFAIAQLPTLLEPAAVAVPVPGYAEHAYGWQQAGHAVFPYQGATQLLELLESGVVQHAVVISPHNPNASCFTEVELQSIQRLLPEKGLLLIDAAFADCIAADYASALLSDNTIVLRSFGKFFGLAGVRLGFLLADADSRLLAEMSAQMRPWGLNHPARYIGERAYRDTAWQAVQRTRIRQQAALVQGFLSAKAGLQWLNAGLFLSAVVEKSDSGLIHDLYRALVEQKIYPRLGDNGQWLRIGLPGERMAEFEERLQCF